MERSFGITTGAASAEVDRGRNNRFLGETINWSKLLQSQRILLVAEAGAGKTHECRARAEMLFAAGEPAFFLRLETVAASGVRSSLFGEHLQQRFDDWRASSSQMAYFFLDSIDELHLVHGDFRAALQRLQSDLEGSLGRATIVVTSRPVDIDRRAFADLLPVPKQSIDTASGEFFVRMAMSGPSDDDKHRPPAFREVTLLPLSDGQIVEFAAGRNIRHPEKLLEAIRARHVEDFARRPQDLIELCDDWRDHKEIRPHYQQLQSHIKVRLRAVAKRQELTELSLDKTRTGVQRLALAAMLGRRLTIRHSAGADVEGSGDAPLIPDELLSDFTAGEIETLLQRPIFAEGGYGRVRFHHRSVLEFLAAQEIDRQIGVGALALSAAKRLLFSLSDAHELMPKPSMRPVAAWLAWMRPAVFDAVLKVEPSTLLLHGDPEALSDEQCGRALKAYVERHGVGRWRGLELPSLQLERLARKPLHQVVLDAWSKGIENPEVRQILLELVAAGRYAQCADLALRVAEDANGRDTERYAALEALLALNDHRVDGLIESLTSSLDGWTMRIARWVALNFYPDHLSEDQLLRLLTALQRSGGRDEHVASHMATVMERASVDRHRLERLLPGLLSLTRSLVVVVRDEESLGDRKGHLQASCILRGLCIRLLELGSRAADLPEAAVLGFRSAGYASLDHERKQKLGALIEDGPTDSRRAVFDADLACLARLERRRSVHGLLARLMFQGPLRYSREKDAPWVLADLAEAATDHERRTVLLHMVVHLIDVEAPDELQAIRTAIADSEALRSELETLVKARAPSRAWQDAQEQQRKRDERRAIKLASDRADWMKFWSDLAHRPALALAPGRVEETIWNLSKVLSKRAQGNERARWDREFLERTLSAPVTDALRRSLMTYWRGMEPTLPSRREEKNTYLVVWTLGLMGLYAEAEDPRWTRNLTRSEAERAVRYVFLELNGLPDWLVALTSAYPDVVKRVLGDELLSDLQATGVDGAWHSILLQNLRHGRLEVAREMEDLLLGWLRGPGIGLMCGKHNAIAEAKLDQVLRVLLVHGRPTTKLWLTELATRQAFAAQTGPFLFFWLPVLMRLNPPRSADLLLRLVRDMPVQRKGIAVQAIGCLFSERRVENTPNWSTAVAPDVLLRLNQAIYLHVAERDDERHATVYTPGLRDNAEDARRNLFNALIQATGPEAFQAKLTLSNDPLFADAKDRITALAQERLAEETDASVASMEELARLFRGGELAPMNSTDMAHLLSDRLDDLQDLMGQDPSPKAAWALVTDENALRAAIGHQLDAVSKGAYTVDQEAVTVDGKETDIRFRALSRHQASIELKLGEKPRSGKALRDTIESQLVLKYMAATNARTGCLLVTVANPHKTWVHPDTGAKLDRHGLHAMLEQAAAVAQRKLGGDARVMARVLDLTPRLPAEGRRPAVKRSTPSSVQKARVAKSAQKTRF